MNNILVFKLFHFAFLNENRYFKTFFLVGVISSLPFSTFFFTNHGFLTHHDTLFKIVTKITSILSHKNANFPTILTIRNSCHLVVDYNWRHTVVESDSKTQSLLLQRKRSPWILAVIVNDIRTWASHLDISFSWVSHNCNFAAPTVAKYLLILMIVSFRM